MKYIHENVQFADEMPINIEIKTITDSLKHWHDCMEIFLVLSGSLVITVETETHQLAEDDIILINSGQIHEIHGNENVVVVLQVNQSYFKKGLEPGSSFLCNSAAYHNKVKFNELKRIIAKLIHTYYNDKEDNELTILSFSYQLILELVKGFKISEEKNAASSSKSLQRLGDIIRYLNENYAENITLEEVADREYLSPSYLSHFFKLNMGVTFFNYLTGIRMNHAVNNLLTTNLTIEQIAIDNGFANCRYFVNTFKKQFGMLPRQFRSTKKQSKAQQKKAKTEQNGYGNLLLLKRHDFLNKLGEYLDSAAENEVTDNTAKHKIVEINSKTHSRNLTHTFRIFTGVGRAKEMLYESVRQQVRTIQKEIGFRYVKFHGILDDSMMLYNEDYNGNAYLTYTYVDEVMDFLMSVRLKPLIELSFMPKLLAADPSVTVFYNPVILSAPKDYSKWAFLITSLTNHFIERYGREEVRSWLFTFWNVPFESYVFSFETNETGYELYRLTRSCVKQCDSQLVFGAPSYGPLGFEGPEFYDFLDHCKTNNCFPDFYTIHSYPITSGANKDMTIFDLKSQKDSIILSEDPDFMGNLIKCIKKNLLPYPRLPVYITEWASTSNHREWLNDTCYRSAYIVKNILENYDQVDSFGNWCLSDILEELPYDNQLFHGELGLFTTYGIKKPAYYAFVFLNKLMNTLVESGPGYFVTTDQKENYAILLYNYIHISPLYARGVMFNVTFIERYNAFVDSSPMEVDILLNNADNGSYTVTEYVVNRQSGSAFDEWVRMGAVPLVSEEEINTLKGRSMPRLNKTDMEVNNKRINYYSKLEPHEIRLVEIRKKEQFR